MHRLVTVCLSCALVVSAVPGSGQERLSLEGAFARARTHSPSVVAARMRVDEARARLRGAARPRDNPVLDTAAGKRQEAGWDVEVGLSQTLELGGRRGARIAVAEAALARDVALAEEALRTALREVGGIYLTAAGAQERLRVAGTAAANSDDILRVAQRRHEQGDVATLDVNLAQSAAARARADVHAIGATRAAALGTLRALLNLETDIPLTLEAKDAGVSTAGEVNDLLAAAMQRADVKALEADLREAEAEARLGKSLAWPEVTPGVRYERDDGTSILWGGVTFTLPVLNRGQEAREVAEARAQRVRLELDALRLGVRNEVRAAWTVYSLRQKAADELRAQMTVLDDNDALARRSYEVGQIGLGELLLVRRETAEVRAAVLERIAEAAEARIELQARAGVLR